MLKKNRQTPLLVAGSIVLIIMSSVIQPEGSTILGALQTLLLGLGLLGCCMAILRFVKANKKR